MDERAGPAKKLSLLVFVLAFCLYGFLIFSFFSPYQFHKYVLAARQAIEGALPAERLSDFSPLYLLFHILVQKFLKQPDLFLKLAQVVWASLSASLLFLILRKFVRLPVAVIGTAAFILNPTLIVLTQTYEPEALALFLLLGFFYFALRDDWSSHLLSGSLAGLAFLTRPNVLLVLLFVPVYYLVKPSRPRRKRLVSVLCFSLPVLLSLFLLLIRSDRMTGRATLLTMNPGTVFYEGNNPLSWGTTSVYPYLVYDLARQYSQTPDVQHDLYRRLARLSTGKDLTVSEVNSYWMGKAVRFIRDHPRRYWQVLAHKLFHMFHSYDWHDLYNAYWNQRKLSRSVIPTIPWGIISALAWLGLITQAPRWKQSLLFYALFAGQAGVMLVFYVSARQRLALLPALLFFACAALDFMASRKRRWLLLAAVIPLSAVLVIPTSLMREEDHLWQGVRASGDHLSEAYRQRKATDYPEAEIRAALALAAAPWLLDSVRPSDLVFEPAGFAGDALAHLKPATSSETFDQAFLLLEDGKPEKAEVAWEELLEQGRRFKRDYYQPSAPQYYLGLASIQRGDREAACRFLLEGLRSSPGDPYILAALTALTGDARYSRTLFGYLDDISAHLYLGKAYLLTGESGQAAVHFAQVADRLPDYRPAQIYLAAAKGLAGDEEAAASLYMDMVGGRPDPVLLEKPLLRIFKARSDKSPADVRALLEYGIVLRQFGHTKEALAVLNRADDLGSPEWADRVRREIQAIERIIEAHR
jgi:tetratricopeptide (TPR) repeat protein